MAYTGQPVYNLFTVKDESNTAVTGLTLSDFTVTLQKREGTSLVAAGEVVTVPEIGGGQYWATYTPSGVGTYSLDISTNDDDYYLSSYHWDTEVYGFAATSGVYLTTRERFKDVYGYSTGQTGDDDQIDLLLPIVTDLFERYTRRKLVPTEVTEYTQSRVSRSTKLFLRNFEINSITSIYESEDIPRNFTKAANLLAADDDYIYDPSTGIVHRLDGCYWSTEPRSIKIIYNAGFNTIPADLEHLAQKWIAIELFKSSNDAQASTEMQGVGGMNWSLVGNSMTKEIRMGLDKYRKLT